MQQLPKQPSDQERAALARFADSLDGGLILGLLQRNAQAFLQLSLGVESEARSRQAQGGYVALDSFVTLVRTAGQPANR